MRSVTVKAGKKYEVLIGTGILDSVSELIAGVTKTKHVIVVSDDNVYPLYGQTVVKKLEDDGYQVERFVFPHGEASKNLSVFGELQEKMCDAHLSREDLLIAVGGGVVGDLAGFAAATYQRGIPFVQIPTTLLAAVDSSVGGKTAVDLPNGKNQVGCFYQPSLVICDPTTLSTLPDSEYRNGCAEIIKYGVLRMVALSEPFYGMSIIMEGMMQGVGETIKPLLCSISTMWVIRILGTFLCTRVWGLGLIAAWSCMITHNLVLFLVMLIIFLSGRWNPLNRTTE